MGPQAVPATLRSGLVEGDLVERMAADLAAGFLGGGDEAWPELRDRYMS